MPSSGPAVSGVPRLRRFLCADPTHEASYRCRDRHCQSASYAHSYGCAQYRRATCTGPRDAKGHESNESAQHYRQGASGGRDQQESDYRQHSSGREAQRRVERRLYRASQDGSHAELVTGMGAERIRSRERFGDLAGQLYWEPAFDIDRGQFLLLALWMRLELAEFLFEIGSLNISLGADGHVLAGGHRHSAGNQCGYGRREYETRGGSGCNYADGNARHRNDSIIGTEYGSS